MLAVKDSIEDCVKECVIEIFNCNKVENKTLSHLGSIVRDGNYNLPISIDCGDETLGAKVLNYLMNKSLI